MSLKRQQEQLNTIYNLASLVGYWQGTATCLRYERDPKVIHGKLREAYEISQQWFKMREQEGVTFDQVAAILEAGGELREVVEGAESKQN